MIRAACALALLAASCGGGRTPPARPAAPVAPNPRPDGTLVAELARGARPLAPWLDGERGVLVLSYVEPSPSGDGDVAPGAIEHSILCGEIQPATVLARLAELTYVEEVEYIVCEPEQDDAIVCGYRGLGEYATSIDVTFQKDDARAWRLAGIEQFSENALGEEWLEAMSDYRDLAWAEAAKGCP
jgi:hypothetical protein